MCPLEKRVFPSPTMPRSPRHLGGVARIVDAAGTASCAEPWNPLNQALKYPITRGKGMTRKLLMTALLLGVLLMSGCASVQRASRSADAQAKLFVPTTGKATLYIYRNEIFGSAIKMPLLVDGMAVGDTGPKTYVEQVLPPGTHVITSKTENDSTLTLYTEPGHTYYIWQEVKMGMFVARSKLHSVDEETGRAAVNKCSLIESSNTTEYPASARPVTAVYPTDSAARTDSSVAEAALAPEVTPSTVSAVTTVTVAESGDVLASSDSRVSPPVFTAAQNIAASKQCDRMIHTTGVDGTRIQFAASCAANQPTLHIACDGARCTAM